MVMTFPSSTTTDVKAEAPARVPMSPAMIFRIALVALKSIIMSLWAGLPSGKSWPAFWTPKRPFRTDLPLKPMTWSTGARIPRSNKAFAKGSQSPSLTLTLGAGITSGSSASSSWQSLGFNTISLTLPSHNEANSAMPPKPSGGRLGNTRSNSRASAFWITSPWYEMRASFTSDSQPSLGVRGTPLRGAASFPSITYSAALRRWARASDCDFLTGPPWTRAPLRSPDHIKFSPTIIQNWRQSIPTSR